MQTNRQDEKNSVSVYKTASGLVTFKANVDVNTDGALQSYKTDDLGFLKGKLIHTHSALNTICNGASIRRSDDSLLYGPRRCVALIEEFKRIRQRGWNKEGNYVDFYAIARKPKTERPGTNRGVPCEKDGHYVSQVARPSTRPRVFAIRSDGSTRCASQPSYCLSTIECARRGVKLHDLAVVRRSDSKTWVGAIVGDTNPKKIGEATVIAVMRLRGQTTPPKNYQETVRLALPSARYVVFPGTAGQIKNLSNLSDPDIQKATAKLIGKYELMKQPDPCS